MKTGVNNKASLNAEIEDHESILSAAVKRFTEARRRYYGLIDSLEEIKNKLQSPDACENECCKTGDVRRPGILSDIESEIYAFEKHNNRLYYLIEELNGLI